MFISLKSDKYWAPIGNKELLFICEGDSARSGLMNELGRSGKGYFAIRGKMLNVLEAKTAKISNNEEIDNIIKILNTKIYDSVVPVDNDDAFEFARLISHTEGILVGISAGAVLYAAIEWAKKSENEGKTIVALLPDSGDRYYSTSLFEN